MDSKQQMLVADKFTVWVFRLIRPLEIHTQSHMNFKRSASVSCVHLITVYSSSLPPMTMPLTRMIRKILLWNRQSDIRAPRSDRWKSDFVPSLNWDAFESPNPSSNRHMQHRRCDSTVTDMIKKMKLYNARLVRVQRQFHARFCTTPVSLGRLPESVVVPRQSVASLLQSHSLVRRQSTHLLNVCRQFHY